MFAKLGKRISGIFTRKKKDEPTPDPIESSDASESSDLELIVPPPDETPEVDQAQWLETDAPMDLEPAAPEPEVLIDASAAAAEEESFAPETPETPETPAPTPAEAADEPVVMWTPDYTPPADEVSVVEDVVSVEEVAPPAPKQGFFSRLFGRKSKPAPIPEPEPEPVFETEPVAEVEAVAEEAVEEVVGEVADAEATEAAQVAEWMQQASVDVPVEEPDVEPVVEAVAEPVVEAIAEPVVDEELIRTDEHAMPAPDEIAPPQETFASVEEALPADEPVEEIAASADDAGDSIDVIAVEQVEPPKAGFFARLFGRKSKPAPRPSLEIEVHEDRIEAAAHALDEVSGEAFASPSEAPDHEETFASVEDALPVEEPLEEQPIEETPAAATGATTQEISVEDLRFAPPIAGVPAEPVVVDSRATIEIEPFDPFAESTEDRATVETTAARSTLEMEQPPAPVDPRSTEEIELDAELLGHGQQDFSDTLEIDEKTDEFEILSVDTERSTDEVDQPEEAGDTTEVAQQAWWQKVFGIKPKTVAKKKLPAGTVVEGNPNFLFSKFRTFYNEIIRFKHQKSEFSAGFATAIVTDYAADLSPDAAAEKQSMALAQMLELQLAEANWMGGEARDRYPDAQYAMAVLADEIFTHLEWDGQAAWRSHLLEVKLYKSRAADVELFKRIDKLLKERPNSHVARDLARVYLLVIAAGFQGKYRPFGLTRALAEYRQRLYEYIHQGDALLLYAPERRIFPDASTRTLEGHAVSRFSGAQRWAAILILMAIGYAALAHFAWNRVSADLKDVTERIRAASSTSAVSPSTTTTSSTTPGGR